MIGFDIPAKLNGEQLLEELKKAGILSDIPVITEGKLWLSIKSSEESLAADIVAHHVGITHVPTIEDRLKAAGIELNELRLALGL